MHPENSLLYIHIQKPTLFSKNKQSTFGILLIATETGQCTVGTDTVV